MLFQPCTFYKQIFMNNIANPAYCPLLVLEYFKNRPGQFSKKLIKVNFLYISPMGEITFMIPEMASVPPIFFDQAYTFERYC